MVEIFDSYNKKTTLYYVLLYITIATILFIIIAAVFNLQVSHRYSWYLIIFLGLGISVIVVNMLLTATNLVKMYVKNGELTITTKSITVNLTTIPLNEAKKIVIIANDYRGARSSDGSGNRIEVYDQSNKVHACRFVISSSVQRDNLLKIMEQWNADGVTVTSNRF